MADLNADLVAGGALDPAATQLDFTHSDINADLVAEDALDPAASQLDFTHGDIDADIVVIGGIVDLFPPEISNITPTPGTNIASSTPIEFDVSDDRTLRLVAIAIAFPDGTVDLAYDGTSLQGHYSAAPNLVTVTDPLNLHFKLLRRGGWIGNPTIKYMALDLLNDAVIA